MSSRGGVVALAAVAAVTLAVALWWARPPDPVRVLRDHWSPLARVERVPAPGLGAGVERWRLISATGDTATGLWRTAARGTARPWTVVMLGGLDTGERAALLLPPGLPVHALAMDWPWSGPRKLPPLAFLLRLGAIRDAVLRSPAVLALGVEAVARARGTDSTRVVLLGASLGVPPAVAALRLTRTPSALVLIDGAADLETLLRIGLRREGYPRWLSGPAAVLAYRLIRPLEPSLHAEVAGGRRVLLVNARHDEFLPRASIERLHATLPEAEVRWRSGAHIRPGRASAIAELAFEIEEWLRAPVDPRGRPSGARAR
jgi:hypothetical protein